MLIPFEPIIAFTLGSLIAWYMLLIFCTSLGVLMSVFICETHSIIKAILGALYGASCYYVFSWLFQSRLSMEFAKQLNVVIN